MLGEGVERLVKRDGRKRMMGQGRGLLGDLWGEISHLLCPPNRGSFPTRVEGGARTECSDPSPALE
jgi:hypothetical protein